MTITLLDAALKGVVLLGAIAGMMLLLRQASAARRHLVWALGLMGLLMLPVASAVLPAWRVPLLPQWMFQTEIISSQLMVSIDHRPARPLPVDTTNSPSLVSTKRELATAEILSVQRSLSNSNAVPATVPPFMPSVAFDRFDWQALQTWITPLWAVGFFVALAAPLTGLWQLARLRRSCKVITLESWLTPLGQIAKQLGVRRDVQILSSPMVSMPLTFGALRPVLLIPEEAVNWSQERRQLVVLHELAHIKRWDWATQMLAHIACAIHWFNPLAWLAARRMRIEREQACDDLVLGNGAKASDYARELLAIASNCDANRLMVLAAVPMARGSQLELRLRSVLDTRRNRAAMTTATSGMALLLLTLVLIPLAMLQAAGIRHPNIDRNSANGGVDSSGKTETTPIVKPVDPADNHVQDHDSGFHLSVLDSDGDQEIAEFRVIAGIPAHSIVAEYEKRTGQTVINWQPHTIEIGKNGELIWPLDRAYEEMALRVEADGYVPQTFHWLNKAEGAKHVVFLLRTDPGVSGRVLQPDGKPAAGATVALSMPQRDAVWEDGRLRYADVPLPTVPSDRWRIPVFAKADADGRFQLPTEPNVAGVLIVHETGVREMSYTEFEKSPEVTLNGWGRIEGRVVWKDKPGADVKLNLSVHRDDYGYPGMVASYAKTRSDSEGRFVFDKVLPGLVQLSVPIPVSATDPDAGVSYIDGLIRHEVVKAGEPTTTIFGGQGRTVTGKLMGRASWENVTFHFHPQAPHVGGFGDDSAWQAFQQFQSSEIGPHFFRNGLPVNADGTFTIPNMLPGTYQIFFSSPDAGQHLAYSQIQVEPEVVGKAPQPLDLGEIVASKPTTPAGDEESTEKVARTVTIRGLAVDDETGKPIAALTVQGGKFELTDPTKVTWGFSESRSNSTDGSFSTTVRWEDGWTARVIAAGYFSQPVLTTAPPADQDEIEVVLRLKRGRLVRGQVLDHQGQAVSGIGVFPVGPNGVNLAGGRVKDGWGGEVDSPTPALTDAEGRFELAVGDDKKIAVSGRAIDAWPAEIEVEGDTIVRLPEPAKVEILLDVEGAEAEGSFFLQLLVSRMPGFAGVRLENTYRISNPGKLTLGALPPGKYQFCRTVMNNLSQVGMGAMLEREFIELKPGETRIIDLVREKGARVTGQVLLPQEKLMGVIVQVTSEQSIKDPFDGHEWATVFASQTAAEDGIFRTERLAPGSYLLEAIAYIPLTPEQQVRSGAIAPSYRGQTKIEVPDSGELVVPDLKLERVDE